MPIANQKQKHTKVYKEKGETYRATLNIRHDDECRNRHNTFAMTVAVYRKAPNGRWVGDSFGCQHELAARLWPKFAHLIKWHLCSTDGPMHYLSNTIYHASDRDCHGLREGEVWQRAMRVRFGDNPITKFGVPENFIKYLAEYGPICFGKPFDFEVIRVDHERERETFGPKYTFGGYPDADHAGRCWYRCPFDSESDALNFLHALQTCSPTFVSVPVSWGEGKAPELEAARNAAIWPDATLEDLQDEAKLRARLPALLAEFRTDIEAIGLKWDEGAQ